MELSCKYVSNGLHPYLWQPVIAHWDANKLIINSIQLLDQLGSLVIGSWVLGHKWSPDDRHSQLICRVWWWSLIGKPTINSLNIDIKEDPGVDQQSCYLQPTSVLEEDALLITSHRIMPSRWLAINYGWTENSDHERSSMLTKAKFREVSL